METNRSLIKNLLEKAITIAVQGHHGQKDKAGEPYMLHPLRLMMQMDTENEMIAAVLHDVVEDTDWTLEKLQNEGFPEEIIQAVDCLTRKESQSYEEFIQNIQSSAIARKVKIADLEDNMNIIRIKNLGDNDLNRLKKYHQAWHILMGRH